jgi:hypothetical protein
MADDGLSASELRKRYLKGGTESDANLSASQLRARYGMQSNNKEWSTKDNASGLSSPVIVIAALVLLALAAAFFLSK